MSPEALRRRIAALPGSAGAAAALGQIEGGRRTARRPRRRRSNSGGCASCQVPRRCPWRLPLPARSCGEGLVAACRDPGHGAGTMGRRPERRARYGGMDVAGRGDVGAPPCQAKRGALPRPGGPRRRAPASGGDGRAYRLRRLCGRGGPAVRTLRSGTNGQVAGRPRVSSFFILAMGKHGAHELNYSSDIDLIALFDPHAPGLSEGVEPSVFWVQIVRSLVNLLQQRTRTATSSAPTSGCGPIRPRHRSRSRSRRRSSTTRAWGRTGSGPPYQSARGCRRHRGRGALPRRVAPFIWRKYLDFAAIADIHSIKRQVHAHRGHERPGARP